MVHGGSAKWGFPFFGHTFSDHAPWQYEIIKQAGGAATFHGWWIDTDTTGLRLDVRVSVHPGTAALDVSFDISNPTRAAQTYDFWADLYVPANEFTELALSTDRVITHQGTWLSLRNMALPWPIVEHDDLRYLREWKDSNGFFPFGNADTFSGFYCHDRQQGLLRIYAPDQGVGTKFWMPNLAWKTDFGEMFSGSHPTHDERSELSPSASRRWTERWMMIRNLNGIDGGSRDVALHLESDPTHARVYLTSATRLEQIELILETAGRYNAQPTPLGKWKGSLCPGASSLAELPPLPPETGFVTCRIRHAAGEYVWTMPGNLVKRAFAHPQLDPARKAYTESTRRIIPEISGVETVAEKDQPFPVKIAYRKATELRVDTARRLYRPNAAAALPDGTMVVADNNNLLHFDSGFNYLGKWGSSEKLLCPLGLTLDGQGRLLVADTGNRRVLRLDCLAGKSIGEWSIDRTWTIDGQCADIVWNNGRIVYTLPREGRVMEFHESATNGRTEEKLVLQDLRGPFGVCFDHNRLIVADTLNARVLSLEPNGTVREIASAAMGLSKPSRVCIFQEQLLICDAGRARLFALKNGHLETVLDGSLLRDLSLAIPGALVPVKDRLFLTIADPARLALLDQNFSVVQSYDLNNNGGSVSFRPRSCAALPDGRKITLDDGQGRVRLFDEAGKPAGIGGSWGREDGQLWEPSVIRSDSKGNVYIADLLNYRILRFDPDLKMRDALDLKGVRTEGTVQTPFWYVHGMAIGPEDKLYIADHMRGCIRVYTAAPENKLLEVISLGEDFYPAGIDVDDKGNVIAANSFKSEVAFYNPVSPDRRVDRREIGSGVLKPMSVAWDDGGGYFLSGRIAGWTPSPKLWRFSSKHIFLHAFAWDEVQYPGDMTRIGKEIWVACLWNKYRCMYAADRENKIRVALKYPDWPILPGEFNNTAGVMCLQSGDILSPQGNTGTLERYGNDLRFIDQATLPAGGVQWTTLFDNELTLYVYGRASQYVLSRDGKPMTQRWFKGVEKFFDAFNLTQDMWYVETDKGPKLFQGDGDGAIDKGTPDWAEKKSIRSGARTTDGGVWLSRIAKEGADFIKLDKNLNVVKTTPVYKLSPTVMLPLPDDRGFLVVDRETCLLQFDANMEHPVVVLNEPVRSADLLPDGRVVVVIRGRGYGYECALWMCEPLDK